MVADFIAVVQSWLTGLWTLIVSSIETAVDLFYDATPVTGGFTFIGTLVLFGLGLGLLMLGFNFVMKLVRR